MDMSQKPFDFQKGVVDGGLWTASTGQSGGLWTMLSLQTCLSCFGASLGGSALSFSRFDDEGGGNEGKSFAVPPQIRRRMYARMHSRMCVCMYDCIVFTPPLLI